jgi:hypothetical protein
VLTTFKNCELTQPKRQQQHYSHTNKHSLELTSILSLGSGASTASWVLIICQGYTPLGQKKGSDDIPAHRTNLYTWLGHK